jgi:hypothetical protein
MEIAELKCEEGWSREGSTRSHPKLPRSPRRHDAGGTIPVEARVVGLVNRFISPLIEHI